MLKTVVRGLYKDKRYTFLNLAGLAVSFSCFLVIFLYLRSELTYDQHFTDHERIYRLTVDMKAGESLSRHAKAGRMTGPLLAQDYAQFEDYARLLPLGGSAQVVNGEISRTWPEDVLYNADNNVFDMFGLHVLAGNAETALTEPRSIAISESVARFYFGEEDPIGQPLGIQIPGNQYTVVLVFADLPENSSHRFGMLFSNINSIIETDSEEFFRLGIMNFNSYTYFRLPETFDVDDFAEISRDFYQRYISADAEQVFTNQNPGLEFQLQPLDDIHLSPALEGDVAKGNPIIIYALSAVAIFILGIASINYMNLSTARFARMAREMGVRRTLGADRKLLAFQFLAEGLLFSLLALLIGISIAEVLLSTVIDRAIPGQDLSVFQGDSFLFLQILVIAGAIGLLSGAYPAFFFSSAKPVDVLKPIVKISGLGVPLRSVLIGLQLLVSISVIAGALIMYQQVNYMKNRHLGFDKENKLVIRPITTRVGDYRTLMSALNQHPDIYHVTMTDQIPGVAADGGALSMPNDQGEEINLQVNAYRVDEHYIDAFSIPLVAGRNFPAGDISTQDVSVYPWLVNETLVKRMGWDDPIGKQILNPTDNVSGEVIGVLADHHFSSLREEIQPLVMDFFFSDWRWPRYLVLDINPANIQEVLEYAAGQLAVIMPESPFEYSFLDETLNALYSDEQNQAQLIMAGAVVCIVIAILGMYGLTAFTIEQKTKEIGMRRILGASTTRVMAVMFKGIFALIIASALVASVLVFYALNIWLQSFAYRISISPAVFLTATFAVFVVSASTVVLQAMQVARKRPVEALRYE